MVLSLRAVHTLMRKLRTIIYKLDDGSEITSRELAKQLGVTESAARNRLNRSRNPKLVYKPYNPRNGGKPLGTQKKQIIIDAKLRDAEMMKLALKHI